tara:strand:+ start:11 stop:301 length:291 start_codon:yes stop_codon:yes gene_type:complete
MKNQLERNMKEWTADSEYTRGFRESMRETAMKDLESAATRIEILEADLEAERRKKWELVHKIKLIDSGVDLDTILDRGEALTLHDKIEIIKEGFTL